MQFSLVLSIESKSVHVSVVKYVPRMVPEIVFAQSERIITRQSPVGSQIERAMISTVSTVLKEVKVAGNKIHNVHIALSSPWILSKTKTSSFNYAQPIVVDSKYIENVLKTERVSFEKETNLNIEFVEQKVFEIKVNGYHTHIKKSVNASSLSVSHTVSAMSKSVVTDITEAIEYFFHDTPISFHSGSILAFIGMKNLRPDIDTGTFIYPHGECTDVMIFKLGVPTHFASINIGSSSLARSVAAITKTSREIAESKISMYEHSELSPQEHSILEPILTKELIKWSDEIAKAMGELKELTTVPNRLIIYSPENLTLFEKTLSEGFTITNIPADEARAELIFSDSAHRDTLHTLQIFGLSLVELHG